MIAAFEERSAEIEAYFNFVAAMEERRLTVQDGVIAIVTQVDKPDGETETVVTPVSADLEGTLKAGFYLLVYNIVESSLRNIIMAIADELVQKRVPFSTVRQELRKTIVQRFGKIGKEHIDRVLSLHGDFTADVIGTSFQPDMLFSGNVDVRRIREVAGEYGFPCTPLADDREGIGEPLLSVKENRNDLAHGHKSFVELGREKGATELESTKDAAFQLLRALLSDADRFISTEDYLDPAHRR